MKEAQQQLGLAAYQNSKSYNKLVVAGPEKPGTLSQPKD